VETDSIGEGTRVWAFSHILPGAKIGRECNICDHTFIEGNVTVGDRVTVKCGVQLWDGLVVEDDVFIGPNATFTNDPFPRSRHHQGEIAPTVVRRGASIGANATILPGLVIGEQAMVGAGSVVTKDVPRGAIVAGNPARITGYVGTQPEPNAALGKAPTKLGGNPTRVAGVTVHRLPFVQDLRGSLSFGEIEDHVPFAVKRYFLVYDVSSDVRGEHAHRTLDQFLICVTGSCHCVVDDGTNRQEFVLDDPTIGLHIPPMVWAVQYKYEAGAVLLVLASDRYDASDYIREYREFLHLKQT
jgi:acetyltransferase-like isoleucine patch superfamily enzyme